MSLLFLYIIQFFVCVGLWLHVCQSAFFGQEAELPELPHQSFRLSPLKRAAERFVIQTVIGCFICKISQVAVGIACKMNPLILQGVGQFGEELSRNSYKYIPVYPPD